MFEDGQAPEPKRAKWATDGYVDSSQDAQLESRDYKIYPEVIEKVPETQKHMSAYFATGGIFHNGKVYSKTFVVTHISDVPFEG